MLARRICRLCTFKPISSVERTFVSQLKANNVNTHHILRVVSSCTQRFASTTSSVRPTTVTDSHLSYTGISTNMIKRLKYFSLTTSAIAIGAQGVLYNSESMASASSNELSLKMALASLVTITVMMTPVLLNVLTKRYITELYFDPDQKQFTATTLNFLGQRRYTTFTAADVIVPTVDMPFTSFKVDGKPFLFDPSLFSNLSAYEHLMGYDKPIEEEFKHFTKDQHKNPDGK